MNCVKDRLVHGVAQFDAVQILDLRDTSVEIFVEDSVCWYVHYGKNSTKIMQNNPEKLTWAKPTTISREGEFYYWYTIPLTNYYHTLLDGVGSLTHYLELLKTKPNMKLLLNRTPRSKGGVMVHPPFVYELLELLDIPYELTSDDTIYERVYYGAPLGIENGKRCRPPIVQYDLLRECIRVAKTRAPAAPSLSSGKVYLSRRAHANPLSDRKAVLGEDNTIKRGLTNEDDAVEILSSLGYTEVFGENYTLAEKIVIFNNMNKYISTAGAGVANMLWTMPNSVSVGGIHSPGFRFPGTDHSTHICTGPNVNCSINLYPDKVLFIDPAQGAKNYNSPWFINDLTAFRSWAEQI